MQNQLHDLAFLPPLQSTPLQVFLKLQNLAYISATTPGWKTYSKKSNGQHGCREESDGLYAAIAGLSTLESDLEFRCEKPLTDCSTTAYCAKPSKHTLSNHSYNHPQTMDDNETSIVI